MNTESKTNMENCTDISGNLREQINHHFDHLDRRCVGLIDFSLANDSTILGEANFAEKNHRELVESIQRKKIFELLIGLSMRELTNGDMRICLFFDGSRVPIGNDLAAKIGCKYVVRVPAGTANTLTFNADSSTRMPYGSLDNPEKAFDEILSELAERIQNNSLPPRLAHLRSEGVHHAN